MSPNAVWTAVEIHKRAENLRLFRRTNELIAGNPLAGQCVLGFSRPDEALVCTTGEPYLTQGTASPLIVRKVDLIGTATMESVLEDTVWESDMGYTKPDMARGLPWVLHVADTGALQAARSYRITGITV